FRPALGLLAAGAQDGEIRLWRAQVNVAGPYRAAPPTPFLDEPGYDGKHPLRVARSEGQGNDAHTPRAASKTIAHDQSVGFAELVAGTPWLVTTTGRVVHRYDWNAGSELEPRIELDATPATVALVNKQTLFARVNAYENSGNLEYLETYSLATG